MEIKIGNKIINVKAYCHTVCGNTENLAFMIDDTCGHDYQSVIDKVSEILLDELDKEYDDENNRCK